VILFLSVFMTATVLPTAEEAFAAGVAHREYATVARYHFNEAARQYDQEWAEGHRSASRARNRGRAHFLAGDTARAILALQAGLAVAPWDAELQQELEAVRDTIAYPPSVALRPTPVNGVRHRVSPFDLLLLSSIAAMVLTVGWVAQRTFRPWWARLAQIVGTIGILSVCGLGVAITPPVQESAPRIVVCEKDTPLRSGNGSAFPLRLDAPLPAGIEGRERHRRGGWVQVELNSGIVGWLPESAVIVGSP
jgi:hypothetical protein